MIFFLGFFTRQFIPIKHPEPTTMKKVTGIGGVFFKCKDPKRVKEWYSKHLGLKVNQYDYGKFVHILDNEGNKIELWEPVDVEYDKIANGRTN